MKNKKELNDMAAALPPRDLDLYTSRDYLIRQYHKFHDSYMKVHEYLNGTSIGSDLLSGVWRDLIEIRGWFNSDLTREDLERLGTFNRMNAQYTKMVGTIYRAHCRFRGHCGTPWLLWP